eukprot:m.192715 g.192715  ORF g.192715 m.192715 type:complete len:335 (+) comp10599_c0_seq13:2040-3044(+)
MPACEDANPIPPVGWIPRDSNIGICDGMLIVAADEGKKGIIGNRVGFSQADSGCTKVPAIHEEENVHPQLGRQQQVLALGAAKRGDDGPFRRLSKFKRAQRRKRHLGKGLHNVRRSKPFHSLRKALGGGKAVPPCSFAQILSDGFAEFVGQADIELSHLVADMRCLSVHAQSLGKVSLNTLALLVAKAETKLSPRVALLGSEFVEPHGITGVSFEAPAVRHAASETEESVSKPLFRSLQVQSCSLAEIRFNSVAVLVAKAKVKLGLGVALRCGQLVETHYVSLRLGSLGMEEAACKEVLCSSKALLCSQPIQPHCLVAVIEALPVDAALKCAVV